MSDGKSGPISNIKFPECDTVPNDMTFPELPTQNKQNLTEDGLIRNTDDSSSKADPATRMRRRRRSDTIRNFVMFLFVVCIVALMALVKYQRGIIEEYEVQTEGKIPKGPLLWNYDNGYRVQKL